VLDAYAALSTALECARGYQEELGDGARDEAGIAWPCSCPRTQVLTDRHRPTGRGLPSVGGRHDDGLFDVASQLPYSNGALLRGISHSQGH
jgi:hypothetical protein